MFTESSINTGGKQYLSIEHQVRFDQMLHDWGDVVRAELYNNKLYDSSNDDERANQLWRRLHNTLVDIRLALCWDATPPTDHLTDEQRKAVLKTVSLDQAVLMPHDVFDAVRSIVGHATHQEQQNWEQAGRPDDHVWHLYKRVGDFLDAHVAAESAYEAT